MPYSISHCLKAESLLTGRKRMLHNSKAHPPKSITTDIRPISLTPNVSKILESFIGNIILERIKERIDPNQYGALKGLSTTHALVDLLHNVHEFIHNGNDAICSMQILIFLFIVSYIYFPNIFNISNGI